MSGVDSNGSYRAYQETDDTLRVNIIGGGSPSSGTITTIEKLPTVSCATGTEIEFDIALGSDEAIIQQVNITQLTGTTADYTIEIWGKDASGYDPAVTTERYLRIWARDIDETSYNENIDGGLIYNDRDASDELHMRLINNSGGTTSAFNISVVATI